MEIGNLPFDNQTLNHKKRKQFNRLNIFWPTSFPGGRTFGVGVIIADFKPLVKKILKVSKIKR